MNYDIKKNYALKFNYDNKGLSGLSNLGNTCFMNSILQCLSNTLSLSEYFLSDQFRKEDPDGHHQYRKEYSLVLCYANLIRNIWDTNTILKPKSFITALNKLSSKWKIGLQQDSHEFLIEILDIIHRGICYEIEVGVKGEITKESDRLMVKSIYEWTKHFEKSYSVIIDAFYGMTTTLLKCSYCNESSRNFEPFVTIHLSLSGSSLQDCLTNYFNSCSKIEDYHCENENCKKSGGCSKQTNLWMLPNYVIITLKRFNNKNIKNNSKIDFPITDLDLTPFISKEKEDHNRYIYSLYALNCHTGDTSGGHYYSYIKNINGNFYMTNDANVTPTTTSTVCSETETCYILFYYRKFIKN